MSKGFSQNPSLQIAPGTWTDRGAQKPRSATTSGLNEERLADMENRNMSLKFMDGLRTGVIPMEKKYKNANFIQKQIQHAKTIPPGYAQKLDRRAAARPSAPPPPSPPPSPPPVQTSGAVTKSSGATSPGYTDSEGEISGAEDSPSTPPNQGNRAVTAPTTHATSPSSTPLKTGQAVVGTGTPAASAASQPTGSAPPYYTAAVANAARATIMKMAKS